MKLYLIKFKAYYGRGYDLYGQFVLDQAQWDRLQGLVGIKTIFFGEVCGKHSDIEHDLEASDLTVVTDNQEFLRMAKMLKLDLDIGLNPLTYYDEEWD